MKDQEEQQGREIIAQVRELLGTEVSVDSIAIDYGGVFDTRKVTVSFPDGGFMSIYLHLRSEVKGKIFK